MNVQSFGNGVWRYFFQQVPFSGAGRSGNPRIGEYQKIESGKILGHLGKKLMFKPQLDIFPVFFEQSGEERGQRMPRSVVRSERIPVSADKDLHSFVTVLTRSPLLFLISSRRGILPTAWVEHERQGS